MPRPPTRADARAPTLVVVPPPARAPVPEASSHGPAATTDRSAPSPVAQALHEACAAPDAPRRALPWAARSLPRDPAALGDQLLAEVPRRGLAEVERGVEQLDGGLDWLSAHEGRDGPHPCDQATVAYARAYLAGLRARQAELRGEMTPALVMEARAAIGESEARMRAFAAHYGVEPGDRLPPAPGSQDAERQASLTSASKRLLAAHEALGRAADPAERRAKLQELLLLQAELSEEHPILAGFGPGRDLDLLVSLTKFSAPVTLRRVLAERIDNARALRRELAEDPQVVWQMAPLVEGLLDARGLPADHPDRALARDMVAEELKATETSRTLISVISLVLVGAGLLAGGPVGWGLGAAGAAADLTDAAVFAKRFGLHAAAGRIDVDSARNLSSVPTSRRELAFESLILGASVVGFGAGELARLARAADGAGGARFFAAVGRRHGESSRLAVYAVFEQHGLLGDLHRLTDEAAELAAAHPGRMAALVAENPRALLGEVGEVGAPLLEARMTRLRALGDDARRGLRPAELDGLIAFPPRALRELDGDQARALLELSKRVGPKRAAELAEAVGAPNVRSSFGALDPARLRLEGKQVVLDGRLFVNGRQLGRLAAEGELPNVLASLERLEAANQGALGAATVNPSQLARLEDAARRLRAGDPVADTRLDKTAGRLGVDPVKLRQVVDRMADVDRPLSAEAARLIDATPALRSALLQMEGIDGLPSATRARALQALGRATGPHRSRFDLENLSEHIFEAAKSGPAKLDTALDELDHALHVIDRSGEAMPGTQVWLGLKSNETAHLGGGVTVQLPAPAKGRLQEIDVLYVRADGTVQAVEVKRQDLTIGEALRKNDKYLKKFQAWRAEGTEVGQPRAVAVAFARPSTGALDTMKVRDTPLRAWLDKAGIEIREAGW